MSPSDEQLVVHSELHFLLLDWEKCTMASIFSWRGLVQVCECQKTRSDLFLFQAEDVETPAIKQKGH